MKLTHKPLPAFDPSIAQLSQEERREAASFWLGRSSGEWESTRAFRWLEESCSLIDAGEEILLMVRRAIIDEERHGEICRQVACAYLEEDATPQISPRLTSPLRTPNDPELEVSLYLASASCIGEVIGAVTIEASLSEATSPLARAALRELLTDEVSHARMGFAYLAAPHLGAPHREALAEWLPALLQDSIDRWKELGSYPTPRPLAAHGCLSFASLGELILTALTEISLPGFEHIGVDIRKAKEFLQSAR